MRRRDENFPDNGFEAWGGYMKAKVAKLEEQFQLRAGNDCKLSNIFNGVSIYVNGFTTPTADELKNIMSQHGGVFHTYQRTEDFIIASNLPDTKVKNMSLSRVVKPEWIVDSIAAKELLDYRHYLLYRNSRTQPQIKFGSSGNDNKINVKRSENMCNKENIHLLVHTSKHFNAESKQSISSGMSSNNTISHNIENLKTEVASVSKKIDNSIKSAADPNFISEFYNNSRLHHISQLGSYFKQYINDLRSMSTFEFPAREYLKEKIGSTDIKCTQLKFHNNKVVMHIDMDCFFVSVGIRDRPDLKGKPVAVTHSKGGQPKMKRLGVDRNIEFNLYKQKQKIRTVGMSDDVKLDSKVDNIENEGSKYGSMSEIASCSYEARAKGLSNGMFMGAALKLCPDLQTIPYDFEGYKKVANTLYETISKYTLDIEAVSCDEMYVDCTELLNKLNISVQDFATVLRSEIKENTGCPCSTGFGGNRLQARLATKKAKPDGQFFLAEDLVDDFMLEINLKDLPGVGRQTTHKLESLGHVTCGSLQNLSLGTLQHHLGTKTGALLYDQCRGNDSNPLSFHTVRKSVSAEVNYGIRFGNNEQCIDFLKQLSTEVHSRMLQFKVLGKCITLKLMIRAEEAPLETAKFMGHGFCNTINKSATLPAATNDLEIIKKEVIALYKKQNVDPKEMRGIGIQITKLDNNSAKLNSKGNISNFFASNKEESKVKSENLVKSHMQSKFESNLHTGKSPRKNVFSPKQKSPVISLKSPSTRRGKPSKINKTNFSTKCNLMNKFLQGQVVHCKDIPYKDPMIKKVCKKEDSKQNHKTDTQLLGLPWQKVRELLRAWLESGQSPLPCDINMISEYMSNMIVSRELDNLYILINFFKRRTHEMCNENWSEVYNHVIEQVQTAMIAVYGKRLHIR